MRRAISRLRCRPLRTLGFAAALTLTMLPASADTARPTQGPLGERGLVVVNHAKVPIVQLYVSPADSDNWGDERLGNSNIDPGGSFHVRLGRGRGCSFDVQVIYDNASHEESLGVDVCKARQLALDGKNAVVPPAMVPAAHEITLRNGGGRPIQQVYVSPSDVDQWGDDLAATEAISVGDSRTLTYHGTCTADLRVVYDNRAAEERRGLDLCATPMLVIHPGWTTEDLPAVPPT